MSAAFSIRRPATIVALLTALNFLNYLDRTVLSAIMPKIESDLLLSNLQIGLLVTVFLLGYFMTAPIFGSLADRRSRRGLLVLGVVIWSLATIASGLVQNTAQLFIARAFVGVGEASFIVLSPTIIDDITPPEKKGRTLAIFFAAAPIGGAAGYLMGGTVATHWGWREALFVAGGPGLILAAVFMFVVEPTRKLVTEKINVWKNVALLWKIPMFRVAVIGYCAHTAAVGAFGHWGPTFLVREFPDSLNLKAANTNFGGTLVVGGLIATVLGGWWSDKIQRRFPSVNSSTPYDDPQNILGMQALLRVCAISVAAAGAICFVCFASVTPVMFFATAFLVIIGVFVSTTPINAILLRSVPTENRASATALCIFCIHLFGDLWSEPAVGELADHIPIRTAMMLLPAMLVLAGILWWPRKTVTR
jgi:MFS transporter, Spinster family, sphingosine-1-phosphate transporter